MPQQQSDAGVEMEERTAAPALPSSPHVRPCDEIVQYFSTDMTNGLTEEDAAESLAKYGRNELTHEEGKSLWRLILDQFEDLLVRILLLAACVSFVLAVLDDSGDEGLTAYVEPLVILLILIANAIVGVWQESNAEKALEALKSLQPELARILRDGKWKTIPAEEVVPGDVCEVRVGDKVPADMRVCQLKTTTLRVEQSQLTGESQSVQKLPDPLPLDMTDCELQGKSNMVFSSTTVANGSAVCVVCATGMRTEIGKIQEAVTEAGKEDDSTPLSKKLDEFGELLSKVIGVICVIVWLINFRNFSDPAHGGFLRGCIYYFKIAVALAVAAIPEGLPAVITTCLALGTRKMAKRNAIVRRLPSVETLGCTTVICSDKTGTLTTNEMSCVRFCLPKAANALDRYVVSGTSYSPVGQITVNDGSAKPLTSVGAADRGLQWFSKVCSMCNDSTLEIQRDTGRYGRTGEPTEAALRVLVEKLGCPDASLTSRYLQTADRDRAMIFNDYYVSSLEKMATLEFSRDRKSMSMLAKERGAKTNLLFCKGAPESILDRCDTLMLPDGTLARLTDAMRHTIAREVDDMAGEALRTLAMAIRFDCGELRDYNGPSHRAHHLLTEPGNFVKIEQGMTYVGLVGIMDPPRPEVAGSITECHQAGIKVIMITGDNKLTAEAISEKIGILASKTAKQKGAGQNGLASTTMRSFTGREFEMLTEEERVEVLAAAEGAVFSRTEPKHKQLIVKILRELGEIAAMTGDGVNDAPALKQADIGIAMGITGTEVAKEASDMVLADDNFATIVHAVEEGRSIYNNMKAFIRYLISSNIGEVASIFLTAALGIPEGLAPVQLLWVNLVTDGLPATALGFNPPDVGVMSRPPRRSDDALISGWVFFRYLVIGMYVGIATVGIFVWWYVYGIDPTDGHTLVTFDQLRSWGFCKTWEDFAVNPVYGMSSDPCSYFSAGKIKASTLSLTVLVVIEMFNALNALSEDHSLLMMPPWSNPWLLLAIMGSVLVHFCILYVPWLARVFNVVPLTAHDWYVVVMWSFPVIIIDEILKAIARACCTEYGKARRKLRSKHE
mmetsp:Transcript_28004/g.69929  ORF Transcript_28004/g.69929 Transcript_28004/m.69929 type:complete len:1068 (-) Transcript_28004:729-3932(-)